MEHSANRRSYKKKAKLLLLCFLCLGIGTGTSILKADHTLDKNGPIEILENGYQTDNQFVYYKNHRIPGSDGPTFSVLGKYHGCDKNQVYCSGRIMHRANPKSFKVLEDEAYAKDHHHVYCCGSKLKNADPGSFELLDDGFARDKKHLYHLGRILRGIDPLSINIDRLDEGYTWDKNRVYYFDEERKERYLIPYLVLDGADPSTFVVMDDGYAKDANSVYKKGIFLKGKDPKTFEAR